MDRTWCFPSRVLSNKPSWMLCRSLFSCFLPPVYHTDVNNPPYASYFIQLSLLCPLLLSYHYLCHIIPFCLNRHTKFISIYMFQKGGSHMCIDPHNFVPVALWDTEFLQMNKLHAWDYIMANLVRYQGLVYEKFHQIWHQLVWTNYSGIKLWESPTFIFHMEADFPQMSDPDCK